MATFQHRVPFECEATSRTICVQSATVERANDERGRLVYLPISCEGASQCGATGPFSQIDHRRLPQSCPLLQAPSG